MPGLLINRYAGYVLKGVSICFILTAICLYVIADRPVKSLIPDGFLPCFADRDMKIPTNYVLKPGNVYAVFDTGWAQLDSVSIIDRYVPCYRIRLADKSVWCSPSLFIYKGDGDPEEKWATGYRFGHDFKLVSLIFLFAGITVLLLEKTIRDHDKRIYRYLLYYFLWITGISVFFYFNGVFIVNNGDPDMFLSISKELMNFSRSTPVPVNIGTAFFYLPFLLFSHHAGFTDIGLMFSAFTSLVVSGLSLVLVLVLIEKFISLKLHSGGQVQQHDIPAPDKKWTAFNLAALCAVLYPVTVFVFDDGGSNLRNIGKSILFIGAYNPYSISVYNKAVLLGWNGSSDSYALLFILISFVVSVCYRPSSLKYIMLGMCMGFSLSTRYSSITVFPALVVIELARYYMGDRAGTRRLLWFFVVFCLSVLLGFIPQLIDNLFVNGSFFMPTVETALLNRSKAISAFGLFNIDNTLGGLKYYLTIHFKILLFFSFILFFVGSRMESLVIWLWLTVPVFFYSASSFFMHDSVRYLIIIFPAVYIAVGCFISNNYLSNTELAFFSAVLVLNMIFFSPEAPLTYTPLPVDFAPIFNHIMPLLFLLICILCRKILPFSSGRSLLFFSVFMLLFSTGCWLVVLMLLLFFPVFFCYRNFKRNCPAL